MKKTNVVAFDATVLGYDIQTVADTKDNAGEQFVVLSVCNANKHPLFASDDDIFKITLFGLRPESVKVIADMKAEDKPFPLASIKAASCEIEELPTFCHLYQETKDFKTGTKMVKGEKVLLAPGVIKWCNSMKVRYITDDRILEQDPVQIVSRMLGDTTMVYLKPDTGTEAGTEAAE